MLITLFTGMEDMTCVDCDQPMEYCGRRSNRCAVSFEVVMMHGFEDGLVSSLILLWSAIIDGFSL